MSFFDRMRGIIEDFVMYPIIDVAEGTSASTQVLTLTYGNNKEMCEAMLQALSGALPKNIVSGINLAIEAETAKCPQQFGDPCYSIRTVIDGLTPAVQNSIALRAVQPLRWYGVHASSDSCNIAAIVAYIMSAINNTGVQPHNCSTDPSCSNPISSVEFIQQCARDLIDGTSAGAVALVTEYSSVSLASIITTLQTNTSQANTSSAINQAITYEKARCPEANSPLCCKVIENLDKLTLAAIAVITQKMVPVNASGLNIQTSSVVDVPTLVTVVKNYMTSTGGFLSSADLLGLPATNTTPTPPPQCVVKPTNSTTPTVSDLYRCGTPGIQFTRSFIVDNVTNTVGGSNWNFVQALSQTYGGVAAGALRLYSWVQCYPKQPGKDETCSNKVCDTSSDCNINEACGTLQQPGVAGTGAISVGRCGLQLGWWTPNILCSTAAQGDIFYNQNPLVNCAAYGSARGQTTPWYSCSAPLGSCYSTPAASNCCGCVDWWASSCSVASSNTGVVCGLPVGTATKTCVNYNAGWPPIILPTIIWRKLACPTCYAFQFDDPSATFTCSPEITGVRDVRAYHLVACPENGGYTLPNITSSQSSLRIVRVLNNCQYNIWPGMSAATTNKAGIGAICTGGGPCPAGTQCVLVRTGFMQCYWNLYDPVVGGVGLAYGGYTLSPSQSLQFQMPVFAQTGSDPTSITWSGAFAMRIGCGSPGVLCNISDCRSAGASSFMCDHNKGFSNPATLAEMTFGSAEATGAASVDFYDIGVIDGPSTIGLAWVPNNDIPKELQA